jgi:hypothetical protein
VARRGQSNSFLAQCDQRFQLRGYRTSVLLLRGQAQAGLRKADLGLKQLVRRGAPLPVEFREAVQFSLRPGYLLGTGGALLADRFGTSGSADPLRGLREGGARAQEEAQTCCGQQAGTVTETAARFMFCSLYRLAG